MEKIIVSNKNKDRINKWRVNMSYGGNSRSFTGSSKSECRRWVFETFKQIDARSPGSIGDKKLSKFLTEWLMYIKSSKSQRTYELYSSYINNDISPILGDLLLFDLTSQVIQSFYDQHLRSGRSNYTVFFIHRTLNNALNYAFRLGLLLDNPCKNTFPPKHRTSEMKFLDQDQANLLLELARQRKDQYYPIYYLAIHTGMRQAELLGLKWEDVDFEKSTIQIKRQCAPKKGGGFYFSIPKTTAGKRTIFLGEQGMALLLHQSENVSLKKLISGEEWQDNDMVFPTKKGTPILNSNLRRGLRKLLDYADLPRIRFHDLRHTAASIMLNNGIPVIVVSRRLGHSKPSITMDVYGHLLPEMQGLIAELMDDILIPFHGSSH